MIFEYQKEGSVERFIILDESANVIFDYTSMNQGLRILNDETDKYTARNKEDMSQKYYLTDDALYYLEQDWCPMTQQFLDKYKDAEYRDNLKSTRKIDRYSAKEFKITVDNNRAIVEKTNIYNVEVSGGVC